jgi:alpha-1,2-mannosyltransferase
MIVFMALFSAVIIALIIWTKLKHSGNRCTPGSPKVVAFFHPYCSGGGGGERVLWKMIEVLGDIVDQGKVLHQVVVYTVDSPSLAYKEGKYVGAINSNIEQDRTAPTVASHALPLWPSDVLCQVEQRFSICVSRKLPLSFIHLDEYKQYLAPSSRFSLLVESFGTMKLAYRGLCRLTPHVFVDTTGCAFTYLVARVLFGCDQVVAYVHYPTISTDMLKVVFERRRAAYNHSVEISSSRIRTAIKLIYYTVFAAIYGAVGSLATVVLVRETRQAAASLEWSYSPCVPN